MSFNSELFKGVSIQHDVENAEETAARIASKPEIKNVWPVHIYDRPKNEFQAADVASALTKRDQDTVAPHIMMGVDKLREKGITGKGIKIAVLDSGVSFVPSCTTLLSLSLSLSLTYRASNTNFNK